MEPFAQRCTQAGVSEGHDYHRDTILISKEEDEEEESISQEVVIISNVDPTRTKKRGDSTRKRRRRCVPRRRWTLSEDCKLVEVVASHRQKFLWKNIAAGFPQRTSNSCRLRWIKLFKTEDAFTDNRWSEMAMLMGDRVMNQWRLMIAQNTPNFYMFISANHPLKRSSCVNNVGPMMITYDGGVGDASMVLSGQRSSSVFPTIDLSLSLATGHNRNSTSVAADVQWPSSYDFLGAESE